MSNKIIMTIFVIGEWASSEIAISKTKSINALKRIIISKLTADSHEQIRNQQVNIWKANIPRHIILGWLLCNFLEDRKKIKKPHLPHQHIYMSSHFMAADLKVEGCVHVIAEVIHKGISLNAYVQVWWQILSYAWLHVIARNHDYYDYGDFQAPVCDFGAWSKTMTALKNMHSILWKPERMLRQILL